MRVSLIHPRSSNPSKNTLIWPPLGLCRIASYLEKHGHSVNIIEDALYKYELEEIRDMTHDVELVGIGSMTLQSARAHQIARFLKKKVIGGGAHFSSIYGYDWVYDAIVMGDGEKPMLEIVENGIKRPIYWGEPIEYEPIDFKWIDYEKYGDHLIDGTRAISILTSRGCPFNCKFCGSPGLFGRKVVYYPVDEVIKNVNFLSGKYGIKAIRIMDDSFTVNKAWVKEFCGKIKGYRLSCLTHVNLVDPETMKIMKEAGFEFVAIGIESADEKILWKCGKNITVDRIKTAVKTIKDAGLKVEALFMMGLPGETKESMWKSAELARELKADRTHFQYFTPFPGCEFYTELKKHGHIIDSNYENYHHKKPTFLPYSISYNDLVEGAEMCLEAANVNNE
jgi:radical SAM superfamily enzyme YgiQ (UPF0313 family)